MAGVLDSGSGEDPDMGLARKTHSGYRNRNSQEMSILDLTAAYTSGHQGVGAATGERRAALG